ncbi:N-acetyltransferase [Pseudophaeobacter sp.]|uniref:GNAT family N-acetyltransferase n=1 Tax=Pseudophaeobacter sp. TaxID=1971739 RepID=UPI002624D9F5|nr:N-acetyltransferase [Pseudophaeobacter sp.]
MEFLNGTGGDEQRIVGLFEAVFTASEGAEEGGIIGRLVYNLLSDTPREDIQIFTSIENAELTGAAIFSRLTYADDPRQVFILSPMAVATDQQGKGGGQALLNHALTALRAGGVDVVITYGDPAFYGKVGFMALREADAASPLPLSFPEGWIGQSLNGAPLQPLQGNCTCVPALRDPGIW